MVSVSGVAKVLIPVAVGTGLALRVSTNGWGSLVWLACNGAMALIRTPHEVENKKNKVVKKERKKTEIAVLAGMYVGGMVIPLVHLLTNAFAFANYRLPWFAPLLGLGGAIPALWLFGRSHADLGRNWSVTTQLNEDHTLVTNGVYSQIRHPMYTAIGLFYASFPLMLSNYVAGFSGITTFTVLYFIRVPYEEQMMIDKFGAEYKEYCLNSGRLLPPLFRRTLP